MEAGRATGVSPLPPMTGRVSGLLAVAMRNRAHEAGGCHTQCPRDLQHQWEESFAKVPSAKQALPHE